MFAMKTPLMVVLEFPKEFPQVIWDFRTSHLSLQESMDEFFREYLQESPVFNGKMYAFRCRFSLNITIEDGMNGSLFTTVYDIYMYIYIYTYIYIYNYVIR